MQKITTIYFIIIAFFLATDLNAQQKILTTKLGHNKAIKCVKYSSNGKYIVSCSEDRTVKLWNANNGNEIRTFIGHYSWVDAIAVRLTHNYLLFNI